MQLRAWAERILESASLEIKLSPPADPLADDDTRAPHRICVPAREETLQFAPRRKAPAMPKPGAFRHRDKRAVAHHILANHELQALEVMAFVVLAFPEAPPGFRRGLAEIMRDEQRHTRMHVERAADLGLHFGALPVNGYIWKKAQRFESVLDYLAGLPLTFEGRNLDHTLEFAEHFRRVGDERSALVCEVIHRDEIRHVAFGLQWLRQLKPPEQSEWDAFQSHLKWPLRPSKAKGPHFFDRASRRAAGMTDEFIDRLFRSG